MEEYIPIDLDEIKLERNTIDLDEIDAAMEKDVIDLDEIIDDQDEKRMEALTEEDPTLKEVVEPFVGMEFVTIEYAYAYYNAYAKQKGFSIRVNRKRRSEKDKSVIGVDYVCSKEGFRRKKYTDRKDRINPVPDHTRVGCKAMIVVGWRISIEKWVIIRYDGIHNHELANTPKRASFLRSQRKPTETQKNLIDVLNESGMRSSSIMSVLSTQAGGLTNVGVTKKNIENYLSGNRQKTFENLGDAQLMLSYFRHAQMKNPRFFYAIQMDAEERMANCFWVDCRSRMAYKFFGDVVTFDSTYKTNRYKMPFVPFTGVNHHRQSILFGCALLLDETEESYVWLLETWLEAMFGNPPKTIITDQDQAMNKTIARVLPGTVHRFCMWHILKKVPKKLGHVYQKHPKFKEEFNYCIHSTLTIDEFETAWAMLTARYGLQSNRWLKDLYDIRHKWIPAYLRNTFCAGMSTTQRSESMNKLLKGYINASTPVSEFVVKFEKALDSWYNKESEKDFTTMNSEPALKTLWPIEVEASKRYTRKVFKHFQLELFHTQLHVLDQIDEDGEICTYNVHKRDKPFPFYIVKFDSSNSEAFCTCRRFEFVGILCSHILSVFVKQQIPSLPSYYILNRWTRNAKAGDALDISNTIVQADKTNFSNLWFNSFMVRSLGVSERASRSLKHYNYSMVAIKRLYDELDAIDIDKDEVGPASSSAKNNGESTKVSERVLPNACVILRDPKRVITKGRPSTVRIRGGIENQQTSKNKEHEKIKLSEPLNPLKDQGHKRSKTSNVGQSRESPILIAGSTHSNAFGSYGVTITQNHVPHPCWHQNSEPTYATHDPRPSSFMDLMAEALQQRQPNANHQGTNYLSGMK